MSFCINHRCPRPQNPDNNLFCQTCGSELLLQGRYRVIRQLGQGGFGGTYEVIDQLRNIPKVLKILINNHPKAVELFQREANVLSLLNYSGIPKVEPDGYFIFYPRGSQEALCCLVIEKIDGINLHEYMMQRQNRPIDQDLAVQWLIEIIIILQEIHGRQIFHRDIKPSNIIVQTNKRLALIDFGVAKQITESYWREQDQGAVTAIFTPGYSPTEQMNGQAVLQSDFFAVGRTFIYLLTGKTPSDPEIYDFSTNEMRWRNYAPTISPQLADLIDNMTAFSPRQRPATAQVILERLRQIEQSLSLEKQVSYTKLHKLVTAKNWKEADRETANIMLQVAGREERGWLDEDDILNYPCEILREIDFLWVQHSNGRFGFSVQKQIWHSVGENLDAFGNYVGWKRRLLGWRDYNSLTFTSQAPIGHLPNACLRSRSINFFKRPLDTTLFASLVQRFVSCQIYSTLEAQAPIISQPNIDSQKPIEENTQFVEKGVHQITTEYEISDLLQSQTITFSEGLVRIELVKKNILDLEVDAIVRPTNTKLAFGGEISRQILQRLQNSSDFGWYETLQNYSNILVGEVLVTEASPLPAHYLFHTPIDNSANATVASIYQAIITALNKAEILSDVRTIAFPSLGTGNAGLNPTSLASGILKIVTNHLENGSRLEKIIFAFVDETPYQAYVSAYQMLLLETRITYDVLITTPQETVTLGEEIEISINLNQAGINQGEVYTLEIPRTEAIANELNIILNAPGFQLNGDNTASLPLDTDTAQESQTARFCLTAIRSGNATITAELYRGDTFDTKLETQIQVADIDEATFTPQRITTQPRPVPQPDFILRIQTIWNETNSTCKFQYQLKSFRFPSVFTENNIYTSDSLSTSWIEQVRGLLATTLENISGGLPTEGKSRLISLGQYLFGQVLPTELQTDFRSLIPQNSTFTLLILADQEVWIPWELLYDGQRFLGDRFIIGRWLQELNDTRPYEFPVGAVNVAHYANVEQPQLWATLLEAPGAPPPQSLPAGVLHDSTEAMRGLHLIRYSQSSDAANLRNAPVTLDNINDTEDIELKMRPAKLNLRRNRPFVTLSYVKTDIPELTALENTWASAFIRAGCSGFTGSLWAVESSVEAAFISCFYNRLWAGASLGEAFYTSRQLARAAAPDSLDWLAYVLFGDPMARPYRPVSGDGYAIVEPIGREIDHPLPPGAIARFRVTLRRNPPVWHEDRVIEVAENLVFENLQVHIVTYGLQVIPDLPVTMTLTAKGDYLGWFTLVVPNEITDTSALVQVYFADEMRPIHSLNFSLNIENGREE